jgi:hypothetical protein
MTTILKNETILTTEEILAAVAAHQEAFACIPSPKNEFFVVAEDGHLISTAATSAPIIIQND